MLRLALIENLRRVGVRMAAARADRDLANVWADQMMEMAESDPKSLILVIADMARSSPPLDSAFVAELTRRLQGQSLALALALTWIEQQLAESHLTIDHLVQLEAQLQASHQVSISNSIGSLRLLSAIDWREFVEQMSVVEKILRNDPAGVHASMEFATRDSYRHATEQIARRSTWSEPDVAAKAIELAQARLDPTDSRTAHVGFYLVDEGLPALESAVAVKRSALYSLLAFGRRYPLPIYLGAIVAITGALTAGLLMRGYPRFTEPGDAGIDRTACVGHPVAIADDQSTRGLDRQLARYACGEAAVITADGLQRGHRTASALFGGGSDSADRYPERRKSDRSARGALSRQSRCEFALRAAHRFSRRRPGIVTHRRIAAATGARWNRGP